MSDVQEKRIDAIKSWLDGEPAIEHNEFEIPDDPGQFLAVEYDDGHDIVWAYSVDSLEEAAEQLEASDTYCSDEEVIDLDSGAIYSPAWAVQRWVKISRETGGIANETLT